MVSSLKLRMMAAWVFLLIPLHGCTDDSSVARPVDGGGATPFDGSSDATGPAPTDASRDGSGDGGGDAADGAGPDPMEAGTDGSSSASGLRWFATCGDPVCRVDAGASTLPLCTAAQNEGEPCTKEGEECDTGSCNVRHICATKSPIGRGGCPISRREAKNGIHYLGEADLKQIAEDVDHIRLATYAYKGDPNARPRLGFIIEDNPASPAITEDRTMVDLYAYTSMVVAALKVQGRQLTEQKLEMERLRNEVRQLKGTCRP